MNKEGGQRNLQQVYQSIERKLKIFLQYDPKVERQDTCQGMKAILNEIKGVLESLNAKSVQQRIDNYHYTYNAVVYTLDICRLLRKSEYSFEAIDFLLTCIISMQANLILQDAKYLDMRTKLYLQIAHLYEQQDALVPAVNILNTGIQKLNELMSIHEADPPVPQYIQKIIQLNLRYLKIMLIKYRIQSGTLPVADWKKKVDEDFGTNTEAKLACLIQCLRTRTAKFSNMFEDRKTNFKEILVNTGYDLIKADVSLLCTALQQQKQRIERIVSFKATENLTQQMTNEEIKKRRQFEEKLIKEKEYSKASQNVPLEYHCELLHYAYEVKNMKIFQELAAWATVRIKCRRIQVKYITDVSILASTIPNPNIPNEYEKLPYDLNQGNLRLELSKLRNSGKSEPPSIQGTKAEQALPPPAAGKEPPKKGGKQPIKQEPKDKDKDNSAPTKWELEQIKHKYVYLLLKRSMNPDKAIYGIDIVMGHQQHGPVGYQDTRRIVVPYIQSNASVKTSEVDQYTGVQATTNLVPYIILYHSKDNLSDQNERKTIITDVKPIFGKHPIVRPEPGYTKIQVDLRQVPPQFIRQKHNDYIFLSYKTDSLFNINQRHTEILIALSELEQTYAKTGNLASNSDEEKSIELEINYDLSKLDALFETMERSLRGVLGQEYYSKKTDFLAQLLSYIWVKYLRGALAQFDYVNQQRLAGEIIDFDYQLYREIIQKAKPVFLRGLKVLNIVLVQNSKADMLLLSKINLELCKFLEEDGDYRTAIDNLRFTIAKLQDKRNGYLRRGLDSKFDKPLPLAVTCSNVLIEDTLQNIRIAYTKQKLSILKQLRISQRKSKDQRALSEAELKEEEFEFADDCKEQPELKQFLSNKHKEFPLLLMALHTDMLNNLFRLELKQGQRIRKLAASRKKITNNPTSKGLAASGFEQSEVEGLASSLKQKIGLMHTKNEVQNRKNLHDLQVTLQKAGELKPPNPIYYSYESKLIEEVNKNPYVMALLLINLAGNKVNDKRYLLTECLKSIQKAKQQQSKVLNKAVQNSIFLVSTLWDRQIDNTNSISFFPFKQLYNGIWPSSQKVAPPILIAKNSNSITLKLPPQTYPVNEKDPAELKSRKTIVSMSVYGKISANGVDVSTNCNELSGTGLKYNIGSVVQVRYLQPNNQYCFACASTDSKDQQGPIGDTGEDIGTYHPMPLTLILGYLAKTAFQLGEYDIAKTAAMNVIDEFCEPSGYLNPDGNLNNLYYYRFKQRNLKAVSLLEVRWLSESLIIGARCLIKQKELEQSDRKSTTHGIVSVQAKGRQDRISNLLILSSLLSPALISPNQSLPFLLPKSNILQASLLISMTPSKFMSPRLRVMSYRVIYELMKWGLENNEIALARRLSYKWGEKKWMMLGKVMKIEEKKEVKKGKDSKEQEVKIVEKYVRVLLEKSPELADTYLDAGIALHDQYADYMAMFVQRIKEQINTFSQYVDNPSEELEKMVTDLNSKLELIEYLKDPAASLTKIPITSPFYIESTCRILRRAIELPADSKQLSDAVPNIAQPAPITAIKIGIDIKNLIYESIKSDIDWAPENLPTLKTLQQKTGEDLSKPIQIFEKYIQLRSDLIKQKLSEDILADRNKDSDYVNQWLAELNILKATASAAYYAQLYKPNTIDHECYYNLTLLDLEDLMKRVKQKQIVEKTSYLFEDKRYEHLQKIFGWIANSCYHNMLVQNWTALQNAVKLAYNFIVYYSLTPFNHWHKPIFEHITMISFCLITMLKRIKQKGYYEYRERYQQRLVEKELALIRSKLGITKEQRTVSFVQNNGFKFEQPKLQTEVSKKFWFVTVKELDLGVLSNFVCYAVQCLRVQEKFRLLIGLTREFSNATQHRHSLYLLPFIIDAQDKLLNEAQARLKQKQDELSKATETYNTWKISKKKGSRQAQLTGEKPKEELEFEALNKSLGETIRLISEKVAMLSGEQGLSRSIIEQLRRDSNQAVLMQKEQHKILVDVGADEARMYRQDTQETKLSRNRKNTMLKELIAKYTDIFKALKGNKTSKDTLSEIQNLHQVGNLYFAAGVLDKAAEYWNDSLANIMQRVNPIECFRDLLKEKGALIVNTLGLSETFLAVNLLVKLSWTCYYKNLHLQRQAIQMAAALAQHIFKIDSAHPQTLRRFSLYRLKRIKDTDAFEDQVTINLSELLFSCEYISWGMMDFNESARILPTVTLMDYVATDIVKNSTYSMKAKLIKSLALSDIGMIKESILMLLRAVSEKDLPLFWIRQSQYVKRERGCNWYPSDQTMYNNSVAFSENTNKEVLQNIKKLEVNKNFEANYGFINAVLVNYAKGLIILSANESQVFESTDINDLRCQNLVFAEGLFRQCLKKLAFLEEYYQLLQALRKSQSKFKSNEMDDGLKKKSEQAKANLVGYLKTQGIDQPTQQIYINEDLANDKRAQRLVLMARIRNSICRANQARNMWTRSYHVLKYGLFNLYRYSNDARLVETGYEKENQDSSKQMPAQSGGKKDDKKGKKDPKDEIKDQRKDAPIDVKKEQQLRQMAQARKYRTTASAFWHLKLQFELGKLLYKQSRFKQAISVFTELKLNSQLFQDRYFFLISEGYVLRCKLKLGLFNPEHFETLISHFEKSEFFDLSYVQLVSDYAEVCASAQKSYKLFQKARECLEKIVHETGFGSYINSKNDNARKIEYCLELQLSQQNQEQIKLRGKKGETAKKGGKDDKKAAPKKDDPKKKKEQVKVEYKVQPLHNFTWYNLMQQEKNTYQLIDTALNSNELEFNSYIKLIPIYIKTKLRPIRSYLCLCNLSNKQTQIQLEKYLEELTIIEEIIKRSQNIPVALKFEYQQLQGLVSKKLFLARMQILLSDLLTAKFKNVSFPYEDLPLNRQYLLLPSFQQFLKDNRPILENSCTALKKLVQNLKGQALFAEYDMNVEQVFWELSDICLLLAEYQGRLQPKYNTQHAADLPHQLEQAKIQKFNLILEANKYLEYAIRVWDCRRELTENYCEIGKKPFEAGAAKLDQDIVADILDTDLLYKKQYPGVPFDESKKKTALTYIDLMTYLLKMAKQSQVMTYSNSHFQNNITKCHRFLCASLPTYKDKCVLNSVEIAPKKDINSIFIDPSIVTFKSIKTPKGDYVYLYILGPVQPNKSLKDTENPIYGRVTITSDGLSALCTGIFNLKEKMTYSDGRTPAQKQRDYRFHKEQFEQLMMKYSGCFYNKTKGKDLDTSTLKSLIPDLTHENVDILINMFRDRGVSVVSAPVNYLVRYLHSLKYPEE